VPDNKSAFPKLMVEFIIRSIGERLGSRIYFVRFASRSRFYLLRFASNRLTSSKWHANKFLLLMKPIKFYFILQPLPNEISFHSLG